MFVNCELCGWVIGLDPCRMVTVLVAPRVMAHQLRHLLRLLWVCAAFKVDVRLVSFALSGVQMTWLQTKIRCLTRCPSRPLLACVPEIVMK